MLTELVRFSYLEYLGETSLIYNFFFSEQASLLTPLASEKNSHLLFLASG